jgi:hypothetical protein
MPMEDIISNTIIDALSSRVSAKILKNIFSKPVRKEIYKKLTEEIFYNLLKEKKLNLMSGFGTVLIKNIGEKDKKVFDKKAGCMVTKKVKGNRVIYKPGEFVKQFL